MAKNAFDKIAKSVTATEKKSDTPVAEVNAAIQSAVDSFVVTKARIKTDEATLKTLETTIIEHVRPQQDELGYCGSFTKSLKVPGTESTVTYVTSDRFSVTQDEPVQDALKTLVGPKNYDLFFQTKRTITVKKEVIDSEEKLNEMAAAIEKAGLNIADYFDVADKVIARDDLDRNQYKLTKSKLEEFRTMVRQNKPALK